MIERLSKLVILAISPIMLIACAAETNEFLPNNFNQGAMLAAACSNCHAVNTTAMPDISRLTPQAIEQSLLAYRNDLDGTTVMHRLARGYSDQDITLIANTVGHPSE